MAIADKEDLIQTAIGTNAVPETSSVTDESKPLNAVQETINIDPISNNNTSTPSIDPDTVAVVSRPRCFDINELINNLGKDSKSKSSEKSKPSEQQRDSQNETNEVKNQNENKSPEGNSDHGKESQKDVHSNDANKSDSKTENDANSVVQPSDPQTDKTDNVLTKEKISSIVYDIISQVDKLFAYKF